MARPMAISQGSHLGGEAVAPWARDLPIAFGIGSVMGASFAAARRAQSLLTCAKRSRAQATTT